VEHVLLKMRPKGSKTGQIVKNRGGGGETKGSKMATEGKSGFRQQNHLLLKEAQKCYDFEK